jgi:hypothetical protein
MKRALGLSIVGVAGLTAQVAMAQEFGLPGQVVLGAERLTGVYSDHMKTTTTDTPVGITTNETKTNSTTVALLGIPMSIGDNNNSNSLMRPSSSPRFSVDVFAAPGFSIGGSFMYLTRLGYTSTTTSYGNVSTSGNQDSPTGSSVIFSPRLGYAAQLSPNFAIWPRAGITYSYYRVTTENTDLTTGAKTDNKLTGDFTDVSIEFMAAALPVPHVAVLFGPFLDLPLGGGSKLVTAGTESAIHPSLSYLSFGITAGLAAYF